jgi:hypothetical protein
MLAGHPTKKSQKNNRRQTEKTVDPFALWFTMLSNMYSSILDPIPPYKLDTPIRNLILHTLWKPEISNFYT